MASGASEMLLGGSGGATCSEPEEAEPSVAGAVEPEDRRTANEMNAARRKAMRDMLYRKES